MDWYYADPCTSLALCGDDICIGSDLRVSKIIFFKNMCDLKTLFLWMYHTYPHNSRIAWDTFENIPEYMSIYSSKWTQKRVRNEQHKIDQNDQIISIF